MKSRQDQVRVGFAARAGRRAIAVALCASALAVLMGGCVSTNLMATLRVYASKSESRMLAASTSDMGWGFYSHPYIFNYPWGGLLVRYYLEGDVSASFLGPNRAAGSAVSRDGGKTWAHGATNLLKPEAFGPYYGGCITTLGNSVLIVQERKGLRADAQGNVMQVANVPFKTPLQAGVMAKNGVVLPDGTILLVADSWSTAENRSKCIAFASTNGGASFEYRSTVATAKDCMWGSEGPCEPSLCLTPRGEILCVARTGLIGQMNFGGTGRAAHMLASRSKDGGLTWTHSRVPLPGVMPKLLTMSNGVIAMAFGRPGNNVAFSIDDGHVWGAEVALSPADIPTTGYCDIIESSPGRILAVYDMHGRDPRGIWLWEPKPVNGIFGVEVRVRSW